MDHMKRLQTGCLSADMMGNRVSLQHRGGQCVQHPVPSSEMTTPPGGQRVLQHTVPSSEMTSVVPPACGPPVTPLLASRGSVQTAEEKMHRLDHSTPDDPSSTRGDGHQMNVTETSRPSVVTHFSSGPLGPPWGSFKPDTDGVIVQHGVHARTQAAAAAAAAEDVRDVSGETSDFNVQAFSTDVVPVQPDKVRRKRGRPFKRKRGQTGVAVADPGDARFSAVVTDPLPATAAAHTPPKRRRRKNDTVKDPFDLVKSEPDSVGVQHSLSVMDMITNTTGDTSNTVQASPIDTTVQSGKARRKPGRPFKRKYKRMSQPLADTDASAEYLGACGLIKPETDSVHFVHAAEDMTDKSAETSENVQAFPTDVPVKARRKRGRPFGTKKRRPAGTVQDPLNACLSAVNTDPLLGTDADHRISQRKKRQAKVVTDPGNVWFSEGSIDPLSESKIDALPAPDAAPKQSNRRKRQPKTVKDHNNAFLSAGSTDPLSESMIDALPMTNAVQKPPKRKKRQAKTVTDLVNACLSAVPDSMDPFPETNADHKPPRKRKKRQSKTAQHIDTFCFSAGGIDGLPESIIDSLPAPDAHPNTGVEGVGPAPPEGVGPAPPEKRRPGRPRKRPLVVSQEQDAAVAVEDRIDQVRDLLGEGEHHLRTLRRRGDGAVSRMKNEVGLLPTVRRRRRKPSVQQVPADGDGVNEAAPSMPSSDVGFGGDEEGAPVQPRARKRRRRKIRWGKKRRTDAKAARPRQRVARTGQPGGADLESRSPSATDTAPSPSPCLSNGSSEPFRTAEMLYHVKSEDVEMELDYFNSLPPSRGSLKSKANVTVKAEQSVPTLIITTERSKPGWGGLRTRRKRKAKWGRRKRRVNPLPSALEAGEPLARLKRELDGFEDVQPGIDGVDHFNGMASGRGGQQYKCPDCGLICRFLSQYLIHSRIHTGEKPYNCHECGKGFNRNSNLTLHLRTHKRSRVYQRCPICKINMSCSEFSAHLKKHGEEIVMPDYEKRKFTRRRRRKRDLDGEFEAEIICKYCGKQFPFPSALERHVRVHTGEKPFKCDICGKGFGQAYFLRVHELSHWSVKRYNCTLCQKSFSHISSAKKHSCLRECRGRRLMTSLSYTCHICKETFYTVEDFNGHMRSHTGAKLYRCLFCDKLFGVLSEFNDHRNHCNVAGREGSSMSHMADHEETKISREYLLPEPIRTRGSRQGISFLITDEAEQKRSDEREPVRRTDKPFLSTAASSQPPSLLASKLNDLDNRSDPRKYFCPSCGRMFRHMGRLRAHMLSHGRGQTFTCECCGKTLESWKKLWQHQRLHRQRQGRFTCPRCGRGFRFVGAYRRHMTEHPEVRWVRTRPSRAAPLPYQCEECSSSFKTLGELFAHQLCHSPSQSAQKDSQDFHLSIEHHHHHHGAAASNSAPKTLNPHMNGYSSAFLPEPHHHQHHHHHAGFQHGGVNPNPEPHHHHQHHHPGFQHGGVNPNPEPRHQHHHHPGFQHGGANPNPHHHHHPGFQHGGPNPEPHHHHQHHAGFQPSPPSLITGPHYNPYYSHQHPKPAVPQQQQFPAVSAVAPPPHLLLHPSQYRIVPQPRSTPLSVATHEGRGVSWTQNAHAATTSSSSLTVDKPHYSRLCVKPRQHEMSPDGIKCAVCGRPFTDVSRLYQHYLQHARGQC